jgi:hypothetical protein
MRREKLHKAGSYWGSINWAFPRNFTGVGNVGFYPARDTVEPMEHSVEIPEDHNLEKKSKFILQ